MKRTILIISVLLVSGSIHAQDIFKQHGYDRETLTLSKGRYKETFINENVMQIGTVLIDTRTDKVVRFLEEDATELAYKAENTSRFLTPDPLDVAATLIPYVPAGASKVVKGADMAVDAAKAIDKGTDAARAADNVVDAATTSNKIDNAIDATRATDKGTLSRTKDAVQKAQNEVGGSLPKGEPSKFGSPQRGNSQKGYRLDPPHPNQAPSSPESKPHVNWWDWTQGKKGSGRIQLMDFSFFYKKTLPLYAFIQCTMIKFSH
jgi:hypothetical protein